jgi:DNA-binding Xre family transcriptional regulator
MSEYVFAVRELAVANGDDNIYKLSVRLQVTYSRAKKLWGGAKMSSIGRTTISRLCNAYACTPNDFIKPLEVSAKSARTKARK